MATTNKDFKVKNGLIVEGANATVNGNEVLTNAASINALSDVTISSPTSGQVLKWNGSAWVNDTGGTGGGISNIVEDTTPQLGGDLDAQSFDITSINALTMDTTPTGVPTGAGTLSWNGTDETLNVKLNSEVTLQVGQEHVVHAKNMTGSTIPDVSAVMFAGAAGNKVRVTPAVSTSATEPYTFVGITTQAIPNGELGFVTQYGMINDIDTSAWADGALLYVDPATPGGLTDTVPAAPNWTFPVAAVISSNASTGKILVRAIPGGHLHDVVDVAISSPADNELLAYNSVNGTWINQTAEEAGIANLSGATFTGNVSATRFIGIIDGGSA